MSLILREKSIKRTWVKITHLVEYKTHSLVLVRTAEDIAAEAIEYALKDKSLTWEDLLSTEAHIFRVARKVYNMPTDVACRKYSVTPTNLHKIVCVVRQILRTDGHLLLAA